LATAIQQIWPNMDFRGVVVLVAAVFGGWSSFADPRPGLRLFHVMEWTAAAVGFGSTFTLINVVFEHPTGNLTVSRVTALILVVLGASAYGWWLVRGASRFVSTPAERAERGAEARAEGARNAAAFIATLDLPDDEEERPAERSSD
jgi:hypothetical protein